MDEFAYLVSTIRNLPFVCSELCKTPHSRFFLKSSRQRQRRKVGVGDYISFFENWSTQTSDPTILLSLCFPYRSIGL